MREGKTQSSVTPHGDAADRSPGAAEANSILAFPVGRELLQKKIVVAHRAIGRVDVEAAPSFTGHYEKVSYLMLIAVIIKQGPAAAVEKSLLVRAYAMSEIKDCFTL